MNWTASSGIFLLERCGLVKMCVCVTMIKFALQQMFMTRDQVFAVLEEGDVDHKL